FLLTLDIFTIKGYIQLLENILAKGYDIVKFFSKTEFPLSQKKQAEEVCHEALKAIASGNGEQSEKARILLETYNEKINSHNVQQFWENIRLRNERFKTRNVQLHLDEKKKQQFIQVESNVIEEFHVTGNRLLSEFKATTSANLMNDPGSKEKRTMDSGELSKNSKKVGTEYNL
ncbi:10570_t:CDS:2, partial [Diversispora eburnea]